MLQADDLVLPMLAYVHNDENLETFRPAVQTDDGVALLENAPLQGHEGLYLVGGKALAHDLVGYYGANNIRVAHLPEEIYDVFRSKAGDTPFEVALGVISKEDRRYGEYCPDEVGFHLMLRWIERKQEGNEVHVFMDNEGNAFSLVSACTTIRAHPLVPGQYRLEVWNGRSPRPYDAEGRRFFPTEDDPLRDAIRGIKRDVNKVAGNYRLPKKMLHCDIAVTPIDPTVLAGGMLVQSGEPRTEVEVTTALFYEQENGSWDIGLSEETVEDIVTTVDDSAHARMQDVLMNDREGV